MKLDLMAPSQSWAGTEVLARAAQDAGLSGLVFTETTSAPWISLASAARATSTLELACGIAVAFARSPMVTAQLAWEIAGNSGGRFRLGLGSQVRAHIERRYSMPFEPPGPRLRDYVLALKACLRAFDRIAPLDHHGPYYDLTLLPDAWTPPHHEHGNVKIDLAAVNPWMCAMAAEVADGIHVHPLHSEHYLSERLLPAIARGCAAASRRIEEVSVIVPVFVVPGDSRAERAPFLEHARSQIAFYGSTRNYAFQFDDLGYEGTSARLNALLRAGDLGAMSQVVTDEMLAHFAVIGSWEEIPELLGARYAGKADRLVLYLDPALVTPSSLDRWGVVARALAGAP